MNIIENIEKEQMSKLMEGKNLPDFKPGDTLKVHTKVKEGDRERIQVYEGVCIARKNDGLNSSFTVRKISFGEGVERVFPLYSPNVAKIEVSRIGKIRRAKLYFLRALRGRSARIADDLAAAAKARPARQVPRHRRARRVRRHLHHRRVYAQCRLAGDLYDGSLPRRLRHSRRAARRRHHRALHRRHADGQKERHHQTAPRRGNARVGVRHLFG